jgi:hypothetical protein
VLVIAADAVIRNKIKLKSIYVVLGGIREIRIVRQNDLEMGVDFSLFYLRLFFFCNAEALNLNLYAVVNKRVAACSVIWAGLRFAEFTLYVYKKKKK